MHAHTDPDGNVDETGNPPQFAIVEGETLDLRSLNHLTLAKANWWPVLEADKPANTATDGWDPQYTFDGERVVQSWISRPKTSAELLADTEAANQQTIALALEASLASLQAIIDDTNANINSNPAARIKDFARVQRRLIRLVIRRFDGTA